MNEAPGSLGHLAATSKQFVRRLLPLGANRLELLMLETKEEYPQILHIVLLALGTSLCLLLAVLSLTGLIVVLGWNFSPTLVLLALTGSYLFGGLCLVRKLIVFCKGWRALPVSRDQFSKDRECINQFMK